MTRKKREARSTTQKKPADPIRRRRPDHKADGGVTGSVIRKQIVDLLDGLVPRTEGLQIVDEVMAYLKFPGWTQKENNLLEKIRSRLKTNEQAKRYLAAYVVEALARNLEQQTAERRVFIESGSTLAYVASQLADRCVAGPAGLSKLNVVTNNFMAQLSLFGVLSVGVTSGDLRPSYLAYLPFAIGDGVPTRADLVFSDRLAFVRLDRELAQVDTIFCTSSTFGFLIGPLTRTRDNAIFKYCLLNNHARRPIRFCIAGAQVFAKRLDGGGYLASDVQRHVTDECFLVFDFESISETDASGPPDLDVLKARELKRRTASAELGLVPGRDPRFLDGSPIAGAYRTWLGFLGSAPPGQIEILIGCDDARMSERLADEVELANRALEVMGHSKRYRRKGNSQKVLHLELISG